MIAVFAHMQIAPQARAEAVAAFGVLAAAAREEPGCCDYRFLADPDDDSSFFLFEAWSDADAFAAHAATSTARRLVESLPALGVSDLSLTQYEITDHRPPALA